MATSFRDLLEEELQDPEFRQRWQETALAREVALSLVRYRADRGLSQAQLARELGMRQPAIARLEAAEHNPTVETLSRLSAGLGIEFVLDIAPADREPAVFRNAPEARETMQTITTRDGRVVVVAGGLFPRLSPA